MVEGVLRKSIVVELFASEPHIARVSGLLHSRSRAFEQLHAVG